MHLTIRKKKGVKKNASWGNSFRLLLPSVIEYFFPPFTTQENSEDIK